MHSLPNLQLACPYFKQGFLSSKLLPSIPGGVLADVFLLSFCSTSVAVGGRRVMLWSSPFLHLMLSFRILQGILLVSSGLKLSSQVRDSPLSAGEL